MTRPDQGKFDLFATPFERLDDRLKSLAQACQFEFVRNLNRQPGRVLQRTGNPHYLIDISYDDYWFESEFTPNLPLSVTLIAYYSPPMDQAFVWQLREVLAAHVLFPVIDHDLDQLLLRASTILTALTPDRIVTNGQHSRNPGACYSRGAG